ncbi:MAG: 2-isopropylmalate synthase [bacterium]
MNNSKIFIFDTTLRDGEQSPGNSMNTSEKMRIAKQLERLGVDIIEAGFPIASDDDFNAVKMIAQEIKGPQITGLCRATTTDIDRAWAALQYAGERARIHTFIATSPIHMERKLKMTPTQVLTAAVAAVKYARQFTSNIEFSFEDAVRSEKRFLLEMALAVIDAGATVLNIPDTVGYATPAEYGAIFAYINEVVSRDIILSAHCHNDLGLAVANSLAAIQNGAQQIECTINGIGERAGNCSLEEIVSIIRLKSRELPFYTNVKSELLVPSSQLLVSTTGMRVQSNKAIVGANAFAHESGIHQHGVLADPECYEIMTPESVGLNQNKLVLGKHSGKAALAQRVEKLGYVLDKSEIDSLMVKFKSLADKKGEVFDEDILSMLGFEPEEGRFELNDLVVSSGTVTMAKATVSIFDYKELKRTVNLGDGPVDAVFGAIRNLTGNHSSLDDFQVGSLTGGTGAQGEVTVKMSRNGMTVNGRATSTDIIIASAKAYLDALNRLEKATQVEELI